MTSSNSFEIYFSADGRSRLKTPLFFHHTPKTAGTSFRFAVRSALADEPVGRSITPGVRAELKAIREWPRGLRRLYNGIAQTTHVEVVMSHYTALLATHLQGPILAMVRDPATHYRSFLGFHAKFVATYLQTHSAEALVRHQKFNNPQLRSFWTADRMPASDARDSDAAMRQALDLVDQTLERFTLFRMTDYRLMLEHCRHHHGLHLMEVREKLRVGDAAVDRLITELQPVLRAHDPAWLDRILYQKLEERAAATIPPAEIVAAASAVPEATPAAAL